MRLAGDEARARFAAARVARLATVCAQGRPRLVPVTFAVDADVVWFAVDAKPKSTRALRRLADIAANPAVCLLADRYDDDWSQLWWARADGTATVHTVADASDAVRLLAARYPQYADAAPAGPAVAVSVTRWSGWAAARP